MASEPTKPTPPEESLTRVPLINLGQVFHPFQELPVDGLRAISLANLRDGKEAEFNLVTNTFPLLPFIVAADNRGRLIHYLANNEGVELMPGLDFHLTIESLGRELEKKGLAEEILTAVYDAKPKYSINPQLYATIRNLRCQIGYQEELYEAQPTLYTRRRFMSKVEDTVFNGFDRFEDLSKTPVHPNRLVALDNEQFLLFSEKELPQLIVKIYAPVDTALAGSV